MTRAKRRYRIAIISIGLSVLGVMLLLLLGKTRTFVDAHTGRKKVVLTIASMPVRTSVQATEFSRYWCSNVTVNPAAVWLTESEYSLGGSRSPSFGFLGGFRYQDYLIESLNEPTVEPALRFVVASNYIRLLERGDQIGATSYALAASAHAAYAGNALSLSNSPKWLIVGGRSEGF